MGEVEVVDDVQKFHAARPGGLHVIAEPSEIPGGFIATYQDPAGSAIYVMDQAADASQT